MGIGIPKTYNISVKKNRKHYILTEANETPSGQSNPEQKEEHWSNHHTWSQKPLREMKQNGMVTGKSTDIQTSVAEHRTQRSTE